MPMMKEKSVLKLFFLDSSGAKRGEVDLLAISRPEIVELLFAKNKYLAYYKALEKRYTPEERKAMIRRIEVATKHYVEAGLEASWGLG